MTSPPRRSLFDRVMSALLLPALALPVAAVVVQAVVDPADGLPLGEVIFDEAGKVFMLIAWVSLAVNARLILRRSRGARDRTMPHSLAVLHAWLYLALAAWIAALFLPSPTTTSSWVLFLLLDVVIIMLSIRVWVRLHQGFPAKDFAGR